MYNINNLLYNKYNNKIMEIMKIIKIINLIFQRKIQNYRK